MSYMAASDSAAVRSRSDDADWRNYCAAHERWRRLCTNALHALQREHFANPITPAHTTGNDRQKGARLEVDRKMTERWQESLKDLADEMLFKFKRENEPDNDDATGSKRTRLRSRA